MLQCLGLITLLDLFRFVLHSLQVGIGEYLLNLTKRLQESDIFSNYRFPLAQRLGDPELKKRFWWYIGVLFIPLLIGNSIIQHILKLDF